MYGVIEAGGTKFVCAVGDDDLNIIQRVSFPTTTPEITMPLVIAFFKEYGQALKSIGVGSFGPIDLAVQSPTYGFITSTPKLPWQNFDFVGLLKRELQVPVTWTTDVNAAAYGEYMAGAGKGLSSLVYYTIGTGVGGGGIQKGQFIQGFSHPEMGHQLLRRHPADTYQGNCPFHGDCLEGLAAGPAIEKRLGIKGSNLPTEDAYWEIEADYLAQCAYNTTLLFSPEMIIFGGGVMKQDQLLPKIRSRFQELLQGYVQTPDMSQYIQRPQLGDNSGTIGCLALAKEVALREN